MTRHSIAELVNTWRPRYLRASRKEKTMILDQFVALTGYHHKSAIRLFQKGMWPKTTDRRGRPRVYPPDVKAALLQVWEACGQICSKTPGVLSARDCGRAQTGGRAQGAAGDKAPPSPHLRRLERCPPQDF